MRAGYCRISFKREDFSLQTEFEIPAHGVLGIIGRSGSGKTTLLRCIAGLEREVQGNITLNGQYWLSAKYSMPTHQRNLGYVFQDSRLFPHKTVEENLDYGVRRCRVAATGNAVDSKYLLELLAISHLLKRKPHELSGGEKQRVAIARALLKNPDVLLMDEPMASLDDAHKREILPYLEKLHDELKIPILYVSHSLEEVSRLCDRVLVIEEGSIVFAGDINTALVDASSPLSRASNAAAMLECIVVKQDNDYKTSTVQTSSGNRFIIQGIMKAGRKVRMLIRASDVSLCLDKPEGTSILNVIAGEVKDIDVDKDLRATLRIDCGGDQLLARITSLSLGKLKLSVGKKVYAQIKAISIEDR